MMMFTTTCFDKVTGAEMILYDCSYNAACMFLERENKDNRFGKFKGTWDISSVLSRMVADYSARIIRNKFRLLIM